MAANLKIGIIADDGDAQKKFEGLSTSVDMTAKSVDQLRNMMAKLTVENLKLTNDIKSMQKGTQEYVQAVNELEHIQDVLARTTKQYDNAVQRLGLSYQTGTDSLKNYRQELKMLQSQHQKAMAQGQGTGFSATDMQNLELLTSKIDTVTQKIKELEKAEKERAEIAAKNNSLAQFQNSIEQANIQGILQKEKALKELTAAIAKANLQQQQYNAQAVNNFSSGAMSTASGQTTEYLAQGLLGNTVNQLKSDYAAYYAQLLKVISLYGVESEEAQNLAQKLNTLDGQIKDLSTQTTAATKRIGNLIKNFVSAQMIVWAIRKAFTSLVSTLKESAEAAAEAEETYNLFITTFENASIAAESAANRLASSFGMANSTAQEALGTFGDLAAGYGATDKEALEFGETATQVAMDIISYKNISGDTATTLQSIASGLAGNVENFRKLGYVMTQAEVKTKLQQKGLDKLTGSSLQYAQIQARLEILQEKSVKAQGDMIKTLDSTTNVTRRLSEAWKEYEENLGESVNVVLNPIKRTWLEILESINKANKAQEEFNKNGSGNNTYDVGNNARDWGDFTKKIQDTWGGTIMASYNAFSVDSNYDSSIDRLADIMLLFSATPEQTVKAMVDSGLWSSGDSVLGKIQTSLESFYDGWKKEEEKSQKRENAKNEAISAIQSAMSFIDNLNSINGVYGDDSSLSRRLANTQNGVVNVGSLEGDTQAIVNNLLANLSSASADSFVSALDIALGREDTESMLEAKLEAVEEVYEVLWNEFYSSGKALVDWQKTALSDTLGLAKSLNGQIEDLNKEVEEVKYSPSWSNGDYRTLSGISDSLSAYLSAFESMAGLTGASTYDISHKIEDYLSSISDALDGQLTEDEFNTFYKEAQSYFNTVTSTYSAGVNPASLSSDPYSYLTTLQKATGENTLLDALEAQLDAYTDYYEKAEAYFKVDGNLTAEEQAILGTLLGQISNIHDRIEEESKEPEEKAKESWEEAWDSMVENLQGIGEFFSSFTSEGFNFSGIINPLMDLVVQTEAFSEISSLLTDYILPVFNSFLEPLLPIIQTIGGLMQSMVQGLLIPLFPVVVEICALVTLIVGYVKAGFDLIVDTIQWVIGNAMKSILQALDAIIWGDQSGWYSGDTWVGKWANKDPWGDFLKAIDKTNEMVADIRACDFEIADNTSSDEMDLTVLNKLFESGVIDWDEMNALRASFLGQATPEKQTQLIAANAGDYASYLRSGSTTTISYGGITVEINSESGDPEKIADTVIRKMEEQLRNGRSGWSSATV